MNMKYEQKASYPIIFRHVTKLSRDTKCIPQQTIALFIHESSRVTDIYCMFNMILMANAARDIRRQ